MTRNSVYYCYYFSILMSLIALLLVGANVFSPTALAAGMLEEATPPAKEWGVPYPLATQETPVSTADPYPGPYPEPNPYPIITESPIMYFLLDAEPEFVEQQPAPTATADIDEIARPERHTRQRTTSYKME